MEKTKEVNLVELVELVQQGKEKEAIGYYGFTNICKACMAFPKDKQVQSSLSKIEDEWFSPFEDL